MTRVLEFIVALIMVFILAVIVGLFLPSHARIERSIEVSHNPQHIYDVLENFRRFPDYVGGELQAQDPSVKFTLSGPAYGTGAAIAWDGNQAIGDGKLVNKSGQMDIAGNSTVTWDLTNDWRGENKVFTLQVQPRSGQRVSTVSWGYDVDYGWNLVDRYSQFWIHGKPASMIQYGLDSLQTMLAAIPNVDYGKLQPRLIQTEATPALLVSTKSSRNLDEINDAKLAAVAQLHAAMQKLGVAPAGPTRVITVEWGDVTYKFDVAIPINTATVTIDGTPHDLTQLPPPPTGEDAAKPAPAATAPEPASGSTAGAAPTGPAPGALDAQNQLVVSGDVRAVMLPAAQVLEANWVGQAGLPLVRLALQAYADTHGYQFSETVNRMYDELTSLPTVQGSDQEFRVYLPVQNAPEQTPEQIAGTVQPLPQLDPSLWLGTPATTNGDTKTNAKSGNSDKGRKKGK